MDYLDKQKNLIPQREAQLKAIEQHTQKWINNPQLMVNNINTIPVVVHIVYKNGTENVSDAQIASQLLVLNEDFRRLNGDGNGNWPQAADAEIEFCMATVDPYGNTTNGITRTSTTQNVFTDDDKVKFTSQGGHDAWPADSYLNM